MKKLIYPLLALVYMLVMVLSAQIAIEPGAAILHPLSFISRTTGILIFSLLLFGVFRFIAYLFSAKEFSRLFSMRGWVLILDGFNHQLKRTLLNIYTHSQSPWRSRLPGARRLLVYTAASAYLLILLEWIFHVTKVSFMDSMSLGQKLSVLLLSGLFIAAAGMLINLGLLLLEFSLRYLRLAWLAACLNTVIPAALFTSLVVLWGDTFTYTIFRFGILTSDGLSRAAYGVLVVLLFLGFYRWLLRVQGLSRPAQSNPSGFKRLRYAVVSVMLISFVIAAIQLTPQSAAAEPGEIVSVTAGELPDIILIGGDGLSATHMSLYGYDRQTTPNIDAIAGVSLVADNVFANANKTFGSIISLLTSKMPSSTRVIFPPDILQGIDSDQHLPGILKEMGYTTAQIGANTYIDANTWNIHNGFDWVNQRTVKGDTLVKTLERWGYGSPAYFIFTVEGRLANRLLQALCIETVENPFSTVADAPEWRGDSRRIQDLLNLLDGTSEPLFVHIHLLETHGPKYEPAIQNFSSGIEQDEKWMTDFYDDTILSFDAYIGELIDALKASGRLDQTLLIIYSDHAMGFQTIERIPLLIHFPQEEHIGRIQTNVQNLDIAPTILDYLDVPVPEWMEGDSILQFSTQVREPIFAVRINAAAKVDTQTGNDPEAVPFRTENHPFTIIQVFYCQRIYTLDLAAHEWSTRGIKGYVVPCPTDSLLDLDQVHQVAVEFLASQGYDTSIVP